MLSSIQAKIVLVILVVLFVGLTVATVLSVRNQRDSLLEARLQDVANNSATLNISVRNVMLAGEAPIAVELLNELSEAPGFRTLELYRADGTLAFSDYSTLSSVNDTLGREAFPETPRRTGETTGAAAFQDAVEFHTPQVVENLEAQQLEYYFPILNYQECRVCHGSDHFVRGVAYYQVSLASVFQRIDRTRNSFIGLFVLVGAIVATALVSSMRRIVVQPIRQIGDVVTRVGDGDLDVQAKVTGSREFGTLSTKINSMIDGLKERNRLEIENQVIDARDQENRKYLDNIAEGLVLIDRDLCISNQYSRYVETLFGTSEIAGRAFSDFIFPDAGPDSEERQELERFLTMIFENTATEMDMIMSINPLAEKKIRVPDSSITTPDGQREVIFSTTFQRILDQDGKVDRVMAIFEDRTDIIHTREQLESERLKYESDIEHIAVLLQNGPDAYSELEQLSAKATASMETAIVRPPAGDDKNSLMRTLHSLKGSARYLEFRTVADIAHRAEELVGSDEYEGLRELIDQLNGQMEGLSRINEKFRSFAETVSSDKPTNSALDSFLERIKKMALEIAQQLEKEISVSISNRLETVPNLSVVQNSIIHLMRNAIDHGVDDKYERLSNGKPAAATIALSLDESALDFRISVSDDGSGIDYEAIRRVATERGILSPGQDYTEKQLLQTLFTPSFTTRSTATDVSGRGVGLDAVQDEIKKLGGRITVASRPGGGTRFTLIIPKEAPK